MKTPLIEPLEARIAPATFSIMGPAATAEGNTGTTDFVFKVTLTDAITSDVTVHFATANGTVLTTQATVADNDYVAAAGTLTFVSGGATEQLIHVLVNGDGKREVDELFSVSLDTPTGGATIDLSKTTATATILNDDPVPTVSIGNSSIVEGDAGTKVMTFDVTLSNLSSSTVSVNVSTADVTATAGVDYDALVNKAVAFLPSSSSLTRTVSVTIHGDTTQELDETFKVTLSGATNATIANGEGIGTIVNDDLPPTISFDSSSLQISTVEGDSGSKLMSFTVKLSKAFTEDVTVTATPTSGSATSGIDFNGAAQTVTIAAGQTTATFSVPILGDVTDEIDESFSVDLSNPSANATLSSGSDIHAVGTILNDDLQVSVSDLSIPETNGDTTLTFKVTLSHASDHEVKVNFATLDGTAHSTGAGNDFDSRTGLLTFAPGQTTLPVSVVIHGDTAAELDENFFLKLSSPTNAILGQSQATGTILNDDGNVTSISIGDAKILEGNTNGSAQAVFTVTLDHANATDAVTVQVATVDGTATIADGDYSALASTTLTFQPGETSKQISIPITGDATPEQNETFLVKLTNPSGNAALAKDTGTGTILNDDGQYLTINDVTITEGDSGDSNAVFLVRLNGAAATSAVTVHLATEAGSASSSGATADFAAIVDQTITFAVGTTQQLVSVPIHGDLIHEMTESFIARLSAAMGGGGTADAPVDTVTIAKDAGVGTILDNGDPLPKITIGNAVVAEGNSGTTALQFTATLSAPSDETVTASYSTHDLASAAHAATAGGDYTASTGTVTFAPGATTATISIPIIGDTVNEFDETFGLTLSSSLGATLGNSEAVGTIQNDEVTISIGDVTTIEGNAGATTYLFHVALAGSVANAVTVTFATQDSTAISTGANKDFNETHGTLTFQPGGPAAQDIAVTVNGDARFEGDEKFFVNLLSATNATITTAKATGTIQDDDAVKVNIQPAASITEGDTGASNLDFTVTLDHASDFPVTVKVNTANGTALANVTDAPAVSNDFTAIKDQTITFAPGETTKTVTVSVVNDTVDELKTENFTVVLSAPTGATLGNDTSLATINDNDGRTVSISDAQVIEGNAGTKTINFTVSLNASSQQAITVDFATADSTAVAGQDYVENHGTLTFVAGQTSKTISVTVNGDTTLENNELFLVNLSNSPNAKISMTAGSGRGTIVDDEAGGARLKLVAVTGTEFTEGNVVAEFRVERSGPLTQALSVDYETLDDTAHSDGSTPDFIARSGTITFAAGSSVASGTIRIAIQNDRNFENDETFQVHLFNPVNAAILDDASLPAVESLTDVTIHPDGDVAPTLSVADVRILEGDSGTQQMEFKVKLSAANEKQSVTVIATTADGTDPATSANSAAATLLLSQDYLSKNQTLTFAPGETEKSFFVTVNGDTIHETNEENFQVKLSGATNATVTRDTAKGTIVDNDAAPTLQLVATGTSSANVSIGEGDTSITNASYTVMLSGKSELPLSVEFTTKDGTAKSTGARPDFTAIDHQLLTYTPGAAVDSVKVNVAINGDVFNETNETFSVAVSNAQGGTLGTKTGTVTITNDDPVPVVTVNNVSISEGNAGTSEMVFTVSLSAASDQAVSVDFKTADGTANATGPMADYLAKTGTLKFAAGETQKEVRVVVIGDTYKEQNETLTLTLSNATNSTILAAVGTGTILNDGDSVVGIAVRDGFGVEGNTGTSTISFTVELSDTLTTATTFQAVSTSGTAVRGSDFVALGNTVFTIAANSKTATVPVTVNGDNFFEATEEFFVGLSNVSNPSTTLAIAGGAGRGTIFNDDLRQVDSHTIQYVDVDGDLATVHVSTGALSVNRLAFSTPNAVGGRQLQTINLTGNNAQFQNADVSVSVRAQPGFHGDANGVQADGLVNVGAIYAALAQQDILEFVNGIDLGTVSISGDLGKIVVGDTGVTSAVKNLVVRSMGRFGTTTQGTASGLDTASLILGPVDNFHVGGNFQSTLEVVGSQFGIIHNLTIDGTLLGGSATNSGTIFVTGRITNATIGKIVGGGGDNSGSLVGSSSTDSKLLNVHVIGDVTGGGGQQSGRIFAPTLGTIRVGSVTGGGGQDSGEVTGLRVDKIVVSKNVTGGSGVGSGRFGGTTTLGTARVFGEIRGGSGDSSGGIAGGQTSFISVFGGIFGGTGSRSGDIVTTAGVGEIQIGALVGGAGVGSGAMDIQGSVQKLSIFGSVLGGTGEASGSLYVRGKLFSGSVLGDISGAELNTTTQTDGTLLSGSGFLLAHRIGDLTVGGDLKSGGNGGVTASTSGWIRSETTIDVLRIRGSVLGSEGSLARIVALGDASGPAIKTLIVGGDVKFAEILGGYLFNPTPANVRGVPTNADAQITTVAIGGDVQSTSIVAGAAVGTDGFFGTADDFAIGGTGTTHRAGSISKIARIIIGGNVLAGARSSGIEAQYVQSVTVHGSPFPLLAGSGNDARPGAELAAGSNIRAFEVPVV